MQEGLAQATAVEEEVQVRLMQARQPPEAMDLSSALVAVAAGVRRLHQLQLAVTEPLRVVAVAADRRVLAIYPAQVVKAEMDMQSSRG